jgi:phage terminase small subunit
VANPRQPVARAVVTGAAAKNPQRHKGRSNPKTGALGGAPTHLSLEAKRAWARFRIELPWLTASDAAILEIASRIRADLLTGEDVGVARLNLYSTVLGKLGATPADRSKVIVPDDDDQEEDEFFGRC